MVGMRTGATASDVPGAATGAGPSVSRVVGIAGPSPLQRLAAIACCCGLFVGAALLTWVWAAPQYDAWRAANQFSDASASGVDLDDPTRMAEVERARAYNVRLAGSDDVLLPVTGPDSAYDRQLDLDGGGVMSWLEIPSIDLRLPVFHGDDDDTLEQGLGHIPRSSLPVGGESSHCSITGHSGMPGKYMFDDLDKVALGDTITLWTLSEPYAYRVYDIEVVQPSDSSSLDIRPGRDLLTLITCTPYRVNTHRLLVHAERCAYVAGESDVMGTSRPLHLERLAALGAGAAAMMSIPLVWSLIVGGITSWVSSLGSGGILSFRPFGRVRLKAGGRRARGRRRRGPDGRVTVRFTSGDLVGAMGALGRPEAAAGPSFEVYGNQDAVVMRNLSNGAEVAFDN